MCKLLKMYGQRSNKQKHLAQMKEIFINDLKSFKQQCPSCSFYSPTDYWHHFGLMAKVNLISYQN